MTRSYKLNVYHPNSMRKVGSFRAKDKEELKRLVAENKEAFEMDVVILENGKRVEPYNEPIENIEDF